MTFDKKRVLSEIDQSLRGIVAPGAEQDLVASGSVVRIIARDGEVSLVLDLPGMEPSAREQLLQEIEERIRTIDDVERVQVLQRAQSRARPPQDAAPAAAQEIPGVRHTIAVASGKGGVGKSTIAVNLAAQLSHAGHRVGLLDSDVYGPSIPKMLGLEGERPQVSGPDRIRPLAAHGLETMSIGFLLEDDSPVIWRGPMVTGLLRQFLFQVEWGELDYLVLDLPPGTGDAQLTLVQSIALSGGIIVTTPQDVALLDVQRGIQMFRRVEVPILGIVENMSGFQCPKCGHVAEIFSAGGGRAAAERFETPFLGSIPLAPATARSCDEGRPIVIEAPDSEFAQILRGIASAVEERLPPAAP